ncbi:hypothetical protein C8J56DRAFT_6910 [Mycena floridula]|nr:hypothetical protein C8J56DRAFT_6910 [Mycena floridula]
MATLEREVSELEIQLATRFLLVRLSKYREHRKTKRPDKDTDRLGWNDHLELEISLRYEPFFPLHSTFLVECPEISISDMPSMNIELAGLTKQVMQAEGSLIAIAIENLVYGTFEADWKVMDLEKKKELIVEGLYRAACAPCGEYSREHCPEMTVKSLIGEGEGEYSFINLLKRIIEHDPTGNGCVKGIFLFDHPCIEEPLRNIDQTPDTIKAGVHFRLLLRTFYIVLTLRVLDAHHDEPPVHLLVATSQITGNYPKKTAEKLDEQLKETDILVDDSPVKEKKASIYKCHCCESMLGDREVLMRCSRCHSVWYCSKACQVKDWKQHKKLCGNQSFDINLLNPIAQKPPQFIGCPNAGPGFVRTPALWRQIGCLAKVDSQGRDYHFDIGPMGRTRSICIIPYHSRMMFLVARRRAMSSGAPTAVYCMFQVLEHFITHYDVNITVELARRQLEKDYDISLEERPVERFSQPTMEELAEELIFAANRIGAEPRDIIRQTPPDRSNDPYWWVGETWLGYPLYKEM